MGEWLAHLSSEMNARQLREKLERRKKKKGRRTPGGTGF